MVYILYLQVTSSFALVPIRNVYIPSKCNNIQYKQQVFVSKLAEESELSWLRVLSVRLDMEEREHRGPWSHMLPKASGLVKTLIKPLTINPTKPRVKGYSHEGDKGAVECNLHSQSVLAAHNLRQSWIKMSSRQEWLKCTVSGATKTHTNNGSIFLCIKYTGSDRDYQNTFPGMKRALVCSPND